MKTPQMEYRSKGNTSISSDSSSLSEDSPEIRENIDNNNDILEINTPHNKVSNKQKRIIPRKKTKPLPNTPVRKHVKSQTMHSFPRKPYQAPKSPPLGPKPSPFGVKTTPFGKPNASQKYRHNKPSVPNMSTSRSHPTQPPSIKPSLAQTKSIDEFTDELSQTEQALSDTSQSYEDTPPMLDKNKNHQVKSDIYSKQTLPAAPPSPTKTKPKMINIGPPRNLKKKRSQTMKVKGSKIIMFNAEKNNKCAEGDECLKLRAFLNAHQGRKLYQDDNEGMKTPEINFSAQPGATNIFKRNRNKNRNKQNNVGKQHQHYNHCMMLHSRHKSACDVGYSCNWMNDKSEMSMIHGHFFHNVPMELENNNQNNKPNEKFTAKQRRQRFSVTSRVKYKETLSSLLDKEKIQIIAQLDFGYKFEITEKREAKYKNPKDEILNNPYAPLQTKEWNDLLKKSVFYFKKKESKKISLSMKEVVSLKLYTDFDALQRHFRRCFRDKNQQERRQRQKTFYFWYKEIEKAINKSQDIIIQKIYHGVDCELPPSTFFGVYYGPVSTTINWDVAQGFAGGQGQVLELYPSFGRRGLDVSYLSNFPEEKEVLFINCSFQIANIHRIDDPDLQQMTPIIKSQQQLRYKSTKSVTYIEHCIVKAMQTISVDSQVISLNDSGQEQEQKFDNDTNLGFNTLTSTEKICILNLLYLQYRQQEWLEFCKKSPDYVSIAMAKFRDMFVSLATNVKAVRMEKLSKLLQIFFYTPQKEYQFPIVSTGQNDDSKAEENVKEAEEKFKAKQPLQLETVCLLFPNAKQISINADQWDFSLNTFIGFLEIFDLNFKDVALQDIYIRFVDNGKVMNDVRKARKARHGHNDFKANLKELRKLGWVFKTASHLHRVGFEPLPELPFLRLFVPPKKDVLAPVLFRTYSTRFSVATYLSDMKKQTDSSKLAMKDVMDDENIDNDDDEAKDGEAFEVGESVDDNVILVDHNPKNCILSQSIFSTLEYKDKLIKLLKWKRDNSGYCETFFQRQFLSVSNLVQVLVLDPLSPEIKPLFYENVKNKNGKTEPGAFVNNKREIISFKYIHKIFPNVQDIFLRETTFNLRICYAFVSFMQNRNKSISDGDDVKLERLFFCKKKKMRDRDIENVKKQLSDINWDFTQFEQTVFKKSTIK